MRTNNSLRRGAEAKPGGDEEQGSEYRYKPTQADFAHVTAYHGQG